MRTSIGMVLAAVLLAGVVQTAWAEEIVPDQNDQEYANENRDYGRGPRRDGPGGRRRGWREDDRGGHGPRMHRGPGGPRMRRGPGCEDGNCPGAGGRGFGGRGMHGRGMMGGRGMGHGMGMMGGPGHRIWHDLELTAEQKSRLVDVLTDNFRSGLQAKMEFMDAQKKIRDLRDDDNATAEAIVAANTELGTARGKLEAQRIKSRADFRAILTPEQIKTLEERWARHPMFSPDDSDDDDGDDVMPPRPGRGPRR